MMKILFLATYFPAPSSPSRGNWALEQALAFRDEGHDVRVLVPTPWVPRWVGRLGGRFERQTAIPTKWEVSGLRIEYPRWPFYPWHVFSRLNRFAPRRLLGLAFVFIRPCLARVIKEMGVDAVVAHHTLVCGQIAYHLHQEHGLPFVVTDHEVGDLLECRVSPKVRAVFEAVGGKARAMVVVSESMRRCASEVMPQVPFRVVYNGTLACPPATSEGNRLPQAGQAVIFCCAKFYGRKDIPLLVSAFGELAKKHQGIRLRIAGDGPDRESITSKVADLECRDRVSLLGLLTPEQVRHEMVVSDIFALVGWAEPFGVVFLEAMAAGLPVVVSEDAGVAEVLQDGRNAVFTRPRDQASVENALERLICDTDLRHAIGRSGQELVANRFHWSSVVRQYQNLFAAGEKV